MNFDEFKKDPQKVSKIKPFINNYCCKIIIYQSKNKYWKRSEWNNLTVANNALNINEKNPVFIFQRFIQIVKTINSPDDTKWRKIRWHGLAVKR